jgi:hypothetical protein
VPFFFHWYVKGLTPLVTVTLIAAAVPWHCVRLEGSALSFGGRQPLYTWKLSMSIYLLAPPLLLGIVIRKYNELARLSPVIELRFSVLEVHVFVTVVMVEKVVHAAPSVLYWNKSVPIELST